jgi:hypothetical protein
MKLEIYQWTTTVKIFEKGDKVTPTSKKCALDAGVYVVERCVPPLWAGDDVIVFVEGRDVGVSGEYLALLEEV